MALLLKDGSLFLHIPKTGGNWVTEVLYRERLVKAEVGAYKHVDLPHLFAGIGHTPRKRLVNWTRNLPARALINLHWVQHGKPFLFCFVRHPLSWFESWFRYMHQDTMRWRDYGNEHSLADWHPNAMLNGTGSPDFNQFVRNVIARRPGYVTELFGNYTQPGLIDFVGKQENLREDLIHVLSLRQLQFDPERIRAYGRIGVSRPPEEIHIAWNEDLRQEVLRLEYAALRRYGYPTGSQ